MKPLENAGARVYRYTGGFLHHKAMLVDDSRSAIGLADFDNHSFRLNFEMAVEVQDREFARKVEAMFWKTLPHPGYLRPESLRRGDYPFAWPCGLPVCWRRCNDLSQKGSGKGKKE